MENQLLLFQLDQPKESRWAVLQARCTIEEKQAIFQLCQFFNLNYSVITRIIWKKLISNFRTQPQLCTEPTKEIDLAIESIVGYLPIIKQQQKLQKLY